MERKRIISIAVLSISLLLFIAGCRNSPETVAFTDTLELSSQETTLEEAADAFGVAVPVPDYLPEGYEIQEAYLLASYYHKVKLFVSTGEIEREIVTVNSTPGEYRQYEFQCLMSILIHHNHEGIPGGLKFTGGGERFELTPDRGTIMSCLFAKRGSHNELWWEWRPDDSYHAPLFQIGIFAGPQMSRETLLKVAESFVY